MGLSAHGHSLLMPTQMLERREEFEIWDGLLQSKVVVQPAASQVVLDWESQG